MTQNFDVDVLDEDDESRDDSRTYWIDTYLISNDGPLLDMINDVVVMLLDNEETCYPRDRQRKPKDHETFVSCVECLVVNIVDVFFKKGPQSSLVVSRKLSNFKPYINPSIHDKTFNRCLDLMETSGLISMVVGKRNGHSTVISSTSYLEAMILSYGVDFSCIREHPDRPLVILRRTIKKHQKDKPKRENVEYQPNRETVGLEAQIRPLNDFLKQSDICFMDDGVANDRINVQERSLSRYFTLRNNQDIRFDQGGRLFGRAFWMNLKSHRREHIRLNGEHVADLDFCNLGPRIAYYLVEHDAPEGDLYDITGLLDDYDHKNDDHRKAIKRAFASCLNGGRGGVRKDKSGRPGILSPLPNGITAPKIRKALVAKHPPLAGLFEPQAVPIGFTIMLKESNILLRALEKLRQVDVVALPQHDGLMCPRSRRKIAKEALTEASKEILGVALPVDEKAVYGPPEASEGLLVA